MVFCTWMLCCFSLAVFSQQTIRPLPKSKNGFIVIAHRGSHLIKPENTIASIEEAIGLGADYVELDLRTTRDGQLVLLHNETVDRMTNGKGRIQDLDFETVKQLQVKGADGSLHHIASFEDALKTCKGRINIYLDFKAAPVTKAYEAIEKAGMTNQILVYVNKDEDYASWRKLAPKMPLMSGLNHGIRTKEQLLAAFESKPLEAIDNIPDESLLPTIRALHISVFLDVQQANEGAEDWKKAMGKGIQGMQTDHPKTLIEFLKTNGIRDGLKY